MVNPLNSATSVTASMYPELSKGMESDLNTTYTPGVPPYNPQYLHQTSQAFQASSSSAFIANKFFIRADIQASTKELLDECRKIANAAKGINSTQSTSTEASQERFAEPSRFPDIHIIRTPTFSLFSPAPTVIVERPVSLEEREYNNRVTAIGLGAILASVGAFILGLAKAQYEKIQRKEFAPLEQLKSIWEQNKLQYQAYADYQHKIDGIVGKAFDILNRKQTAQLYKIAYLVSLVTSGALCVIGGITASGSLIGTGIGIGIFSSILMLGRLGYNFFNEEDGEDADSIERNIKKLEQNVIPTTALPTAPYVDAA